MACCEDREEYPLYISTDTDIDIDVYVEKTGLPETTATVTAQVYTLAGATVGSPVSLEFQAVANYYGVFPATAVTDGALYYMLITIVVGGLTVKTVKRWLRAQYNEAA